MNSIFASIEHWPLSVWAREDEYAYFLALIFHAWGMALLVGGGVVITLRVMGVAGGAALSNFRGFLPVMWLGVALAIPSGFVLLVAYPAKAFTNPIFAIKFACLIGAALLLRRLIRIGAAPRNSRMLAVLCLLLWLAGVTAGKLLLHTYRVLTVS
ncbi:MAG TPA: hypothetical protein VN645_06350 [Steroidobacteraceae bacterium]|nr:hypothetical protein [Steroidobacteraceae bacterium]